MDLLIGLSLALFVGFATAAQGPTNAALGKHVGAVQASFVSMAGGMIILLVFILIRGEIDFSPALGAQWWMYLGGVYGAFIVFSMAYATPHLGIALTLTAVMVGQLTGGLVIDGFGLLGAEAVPVSIPRVLGCCCAFAGIGLVYMGQKRQDAVQNIVNFAQGEKLRRYASLGYAGLALGAGVASALQTPSNAALATHISVLQVSFISFVVGFFLLLVLSLIMGKGRLKSMRGIAPWKFTGGVYGALGVPSLTMATPLLGVSLALCTLMVAQLVGGFFVDSFGWFNARSIAVDKMRILGAVLLASGVVLVTLAGL